MKTTLGESFAVKESSKVRVRVPASAFELAKRSPHQPHGACVSRHTEKKRDVCSGGEIPRGQDEEGGLHAG